MLLLRSKSPYIPIDKSRGVTEILGKERWHASSTVCSQCGQRLVEATTEDGERLVLAVSVRTFRLRLNGKKTGYLAERASGYPPHLCQEG